MSACLNVTHNEENCHVAFGKQLDKWCVNCLKNARLRCQFCGRTTHTYDQLRECLTTRRVTDKGVH